MHGSRLAVIAALAIGGQAAAAGPDPYVDIGAGGGFESNLSHATDGETPIGAYAVNPFATTGLVLDVGDDALLFASLGYGGTIRPEVPDLSTHAFSARVRFVYLVTPWLRLEVVPAGGYKLAGDPARNAAFVSGIARVKLRALSWLDLSVYYRRADAFARDDVFSYDADAAGGRVTMDLGRFVRLWLGYEAEIGQEVSYESTAVVVPGTQSSGLGAGPGGSGSGSGSGSQQARQGPSRTVTTFGTEVLAVRLPATFHTASAGLVLKLGKRASLGVDYAVVRTVSERPYTNHLVWGSVSLHF